MGKTVSKLTCGLIPAGKDNKPRPVQNKHIQILVIGDEKVGKSTLINNYVSDAQEVEFANQSELIRIVNAQNVIQNPRNADQHTNVNITLVDVQGAIITVNRQIRDGYYTTSQIVLALYNVGNPYTLYNTVQHWQKEIAEATSRMTEESSNAVTLYMVGVNPEARDGMCEIMDEKDYELHNENPDEFQRDIVRQKSQRKSVRKDDAQKMSRRLSIGKSKKSAKHVEVKTTKANIKQFFDQLVVEFIYPEEEASSPRR